MAHIMTPEKFCGESEGQGNVPTWLDIGPGNGYPHNSSDLSALRRWHDAMWSCACWILLSSSTGLWHWNKKLLIMFLSVIMQWSVPTPPGPWHHWCDILSDLHPSPNCDRLMATVLNGADSVFLGYLEDHKTTFVKSWYSSKFSTRWLSFLW